MWLWGKAIWGDTGISLPSLSCHWLAGFLGLFQSCPQVLGSLFTKVKVVLDDLICKFFLAIQLQILVIGPLPSLFPSISFLAKLCPVYQLSLLLLLQNVPPSHGHKIWSLGMYFFFLFSGGHHGV